MNSNTKKLVMAALFAALACIATMVVMIPSPLKGYINLGDCIVLLAGWKLGPKYGFLAAGLGSGLADMFAGYMLYAPATFVIKGLMAVVAFYMFAILQKMINKATARISSAIVAEALMVIGYFGFEGVLYGFLPAAVNIPANAVQGVAGVIVGCILIKLFEKVKF